MVPSSPSPSQVVPARVSAGPVGAFSGGMVWAPVPVVSPRRRISRVGAASRSPSRRISPAAGSAGVDALPRGSGTISRTGFPSAVRRMAREESRGTISPPSWVRLPATGSIVASGGDPPPHAARKVTRRVRMTGRQDRGIGALEGLLKNEGERLELAGGRSGRKENDHPEPEGDGDPLQEAATVPGPPVPMENEGDERGDHHGRRQGIARDGGGGDEGGGEEDPLHPGPGSDHLAAVELPDRDEVAEVDDGTEVGDGTPVGAAGELPDPEREEGGPEPCRG